MREELAAQGGSGSGLYTVDRDLMVRLQPDAIVTQVRGLGTRAGEFAGWGSQLVMSGCRMRRTAGG